MSIVIAVKIGSSNTSIFKTGEGLVLFEPTLVAYNDCGSVKKVVAIGKKAKRMLGRTDGNTIIKAPIEQGRVSDVELCAIMLKSYLSKVIPFSLIKPKIHAVVCIPVGLTKDEKRNYELACNMAGIQDVDFVPAVLAGAIGYNIKIDEPVGYCLVNIGGGSTDVVVVSNTKIVSGVNVAIGGNLLDRSIEQSIYDDYQVSVGLGVAENLKIEIGTLYANDSASAEVTGVDPLSGVAKSVVVESKLVYDSVVCYYEKIAECILSVISNCPPNIVEDIHNMGIYMMGGASLITGAEQFFRKKLNMPVIIQDETTAIDAIGAGMCLNKKDLLKTLVEPK